MRILKDILDFGTLNVKLSGKSHIVSVINYFILS